MDQFPSRRKYQMLRFAFSTARRQRLTACTGVVVLALVVPPAFGAPSVTAQIAKVTKLATKADKNATKALTLAKTASAATAGAAGEKGATGPAGPKGDAGAAGATGPAGPAGAKGDKGDTGATGAVGPQGPAGTPGVQGPAGPSGSSTAYIATDGDGVANPGNALTQTLDPTVTKILPDAGKYVVNATASFERLGGDGTVHCELIQTHGTTDTTLDASSNYLYSTIPNQQAAYSAAITAAANDEISVQCKVMSASPQVDVTRTNLTILPVGSFE